MVIYEDEKFLGKFFLGGGWGGGGKKWGNKDGLLREVMALQRYKILND